MSVCLFSPQELKCVLDLALRSRVFKIFSKQGIYGLHILSIFGQYFSQKKCEGENIFSKCLIMSICSFYNFKMLLLKHIEENWL